MQDITMAVVDTNLVAIDPPSPEDGAVVVETDRLVLRRPRADDAANLHALVAHKEIIRCLSTRWPDDYQLKDAEETLARWAGIRADSNPHYPTSLFICLKNPDDPSQEPQPVGNIGLTPGSGMDYRCWTLGYFLGPQAWGKGYAQEAVRALTRYALRNWPGLERIQGEAYSWNTASHNVMKKVGFVFEGRRRNALERDGVLCDDMIFGLIRSDIKEEAESK